MWAQVAGRDYTHESTCLVCWDGGSVILCDRCPAAYHPPCLGYNKADAKALESSQWSCPHHQVKRQEKGGPLTVLRDPLAVSSTTR